MDVFFLSAFKRPILSLLLLHVLPAIAFWKKNWKWALGTWAIQNSLLFYVMIVIWDPPMSLLLQRVHDLRRHGKRPLSGVIKTCGVQSPQYQEYMSANKKDTEEGANAERKKRGEEKNSSVDAATYYEEYHSHPVKDLVKVRDSLRAQGCKRFIYLMGDSSLDNKHWFFNAKFETKSRIFKRKVQKEGEEGLNAESCNVEDFIGPALNGYENILQPKAMVKDVCYWLNYLANAKNSQSTPQLCTIMSSVEESTVAERLDEGRNLLVQDEFIKDSFTPEDTLVISIGGNDVALQPTLKTVISTLLVTRSPDWLIQSGWAPGLSHFVNLFNNKVEVILKKVTSGKHQPKKIVVCTLYYLDEKKGGSWADFTLASLGYDSNPKKLQLLIRTVHEACVRKGYHVPGIKEGVTVLPLHTVLDPKDRSDYCQRVEPSVQGGKKMAEAILKIIDQKD